MNNLGASEGVPLSEKAQYAIERARIDQSCRLPVLFYFASSLFWLLIGSLLAILASFKMHSPDLFWPGTSWLTFGRVRPAHLNAVAYGWSSMAGIGVAVWMMCRLCRVELIYPKLLVWACGLWNLGVAVGIVGILAGFGTSVEWLDFPVVVPPVLTLSLSIVAVWVIATFRIRREKHVYVTQWYIFGAMFWMPWLYTTATLMTLYVPSTGVVQAAVNWWFAHNVLGLWITPIGLGAAYYLIPKILGRPVHSYYLSIFGFWSLALFYSWAGMHHLASGPIPAWMSTASVVGSMMMFIPVGAVALNHHMTVKGNFRQVNFSPTLRFVVFGSIAYTAVSFQGSIESLKSFSETVHFTHYTPAHAHLGLYGFFSMIMFGSMYYIVPRLTGWEWGSSTLIRLHFWLCAIGIALYFVSLTIGGWFQGVALNNAEIPFIRIVRSTVPFLFGRSFAGALMTLGHLVFAVLFIMNLLHLGERRSGPALFKEKNETRTGTETAKSGM